MRCKHDIHYSNCDECMDPKPEAPHQYDDVLKAAQSITGWVPDDKPAKDAGAREWWVAQVIPENGEPVFYTAYVGRPAQDSWVGEIYRVIEHSAYEAAAEKCLDLALKYNAAADRVLAAEKEREGLRAALVDIKDTCEETGLSVYGPDLRIDIDKIHQITMEALAKDVTIKR